MHIHPDALRLRTPSLTALGSLIRKKLYELNIEVTSATRHNNILPTAPEPVFLASELQ